MISEAKKLFPFKRQADHDFIHAFTPKIQRLKQKYPDMEKDLNEILELTEEYIQANLQRKETKNLEGMEGFDL